MKSLGISESSNVVMWGCLISITSSSILLWWEGVNVVAMDDK